MDNLAPGREFFFEIAAENNAGDISDSSASVSALANGYADNLVISEIQIAGESAKEEFVELYNPTENDIDLKTLPLKLHIINSAGNDTGKNLNFTNAIIKAQGYFLVASNEYQGAADARYSTGDNSLVANGAVYISSSSQDKENIIDLAGWGNASFFEGAAFPDIPKKQSIERKAQRNSTIESMIFGLDKYGGNAWDADNNGEDFILRANPDPRGTGDGYTEPRLNTAPAITILSPQNNQLFLQGETVSFAANVSDAEDLIFSAEKITWISDKSGAIGSGLSFSFDNFLSGANEIMVSAIDSDNALASAYANIFIRNNSWQDLGGIKDAAKNRNLNKPKIAVDSKGNAHLVAIEPVNWGDLIYYTNESGEWKSYNVLKNESVTINSAEIKIGANDNIYIVFEASGDCSYPHAYYLKKTAGGWGNPEALSSFFDAGYSFDIGSDGEIYSTANAITPYYYCMKSNDNSLRFNRTVNGILQQEIVISAPANAAVYLPQIAVDNNNVPYLFAAARSGEPGIYFTSFNKSVNAFNVWEKANLTFDSVSILPVVPRFDTANNIHVFIRETIPVNSVDKGIWHLASADFKTWTEEKLPGTSDLNKSWFVDWTFNPVFDTRSKIHLVWQKEKSLYYQTNFSGAWSAPVDILGAGVYGMRPALTIDKSNNLHLLYQPFGANIQPQINYALNPEIE